MRHPLSRVIDVTLPRFAVVDVETSGLSTRRHRILQLGVVTVEADGTVLDEWDTLVRLRWPWQRVGPTAVHGISRDMLRDAPDTAQALSDLAVRLDGAIFTAHNASFDGEFILREARRRRRQLPRPIDLGPRLCTLRMSRRLDPERAHSHRLGDVCERYGVALDRPHDALADAAATAAVLPHLIRELHIDDVEQLTPFFDRH